MLENMNTIEKQVFRTYWNDGLLDLFGAVGVLAIGIFWTFEFVVGSAIMPALLLPLWGPCRERFIEPRLGMVKFSEERERRNSRRLQMIAALGVGTLALAVALNFLRDQIGLAPSVSFVAGLPAVLLGFLAMLTAFIISAGRFLVYAGIMVIAGVAGALLGLEPGLIMGSGGAIVLLLALVVVVRFFRNNPIDGTSE